MTDELKFCKDCKWCGRHGVTLFREVVKSYARCLHPASRAECPPDIVTGEVHQSAPEYCNVMRLRGGPCGEDAKLFEPRP